ncbi:MAG: HD domain-containing protein, partial [Coriobacteriia bacterium]
KNLAELGMNATVISAGLLHDVVEDANVTPEELKKEFGDDIEELVEGVTKLGTVKYKGIERNVENLRKFFISVAKDLRVLVIKLADRLHNIETLEHVRPDKQKRIAPETLEIYAPLANRLSMGRLKGRLEDAAFRFAYPKEYEEVKKLL